MVSPKWAIELEPGENGPYIDRLLMTLLPDAAFVVRGGQNLPTHFAQGSGVTVDAGGNIEGVSVNAAPGVSVQELTAPNPHTGYPGIPHNQVGVTTVGAIRAVGGDVIPAPTRTNPYHATLSGLTPEQASQLFRPTVKNPNTRTRVVEEADGSSQSLCRFPEYRCGKPITVNLYRDPAGSGAARAPTALRLSPHLLQ